MNKLFKLYNIKIDDYYQKHFEFLEQTRNQFDYYEVLPDYKKNDFKKYISQINDKIKDLDTGFNFIEKTIEYDNFFMKLKPGKINKIALKAITSIEANKSILKNLKRFKTKSNFHDNIVYDMYNTSTGRLTVESGPNILTLPVRCRSIFESRFKEGKIVSIDFNNLEPRFVLKISGKDIVDKDIYSFLANILDLNIDRSVMKKAVISRLYGSSINTLNNQIPTEKVDKIKSLIEEYFLVEKILDLSKNVNAEMQFRYNYFGRPIKNFDITQENIIINNYVQSSCVDMSLMYFTDLCNLIDRNRCVPLFVIHDALVLDVEKDYLKDIQKIVKKGYDHKTLGNFPISLEDFQK